MHSLLLLFVILIASAHACNAKEYIRACYFTNWAQYRPGRGKYLPDDYIPGLCTHILFAFGWMNEDFTVRAYDPQDLDTAWSSRKGLYTQVNDLKEKDPKLKTLLSIGGWTFGTRLFKAMAATATGRKTFVDSALEFIKKHGFDGLDIDWEYPIENDKSSFVLLMKELKEVFEADRLAIGKSERLLLSAAVSAAPEKIDKGYNVHELANYDFHGAWEHASDFNSPLYARPDEVGHFRKWNVASASNYWNEKGMPKDKIIVGFPTYARGWTLKDTAQSGIGAKASGPSQRTEFARQGGMAAYYEICEMIAKGAHRKWSNAQKVPYLVHGDQWFSYDDEESYDIKLDWLKAQGYGGAFVWALDFDDFNGQCSNGNGRAYPLINRISNKLGGSTVTIIGTTTPRPNPGGITSTSGPPPVTTTAGPVVTSTALPGGIFTCTTDGYFKSSDSCQKFIRCSQQIAYHFTCAAGTWFDSRTGTCTFKHLSDCIQPVRSYAYKYIH